MRAARQSAWFVSGHEGRETVTLYPLLKRQSETCLIAVGIVSLLAVVTLRRDLAGATGTDHASLILSGQSLVAIHDATFLLGPAFCAAIGNGLIIGYLMLQSGLVPRRFAQSGVAGGSLALVTALLVLFGAYDQSSGPLFILTLPEAVWELSLGIYLIVKGFKPSHLLHDNGRHTGIDGPGSARSSSPTTCRGSIIRPTFYSLDVLK